MKTKGRIIDYGPNGQSLYLLDVISHRPKYCWHTSLIVNDAYKMFVIS